MLGVAPGVRPTEGRVREALFSMWQERLPGARFLDLFAGSGVVGLEARGRGAEEVVFVEQRSAIVSRLERSLQEFGAGRTRVLRARLPEGLRLAAAYGPFDLVFADPPYDFDQYRALLAAIAPLLSEEGHCVIEYRVGGALPDRESGLIADGDRAYGDCALRFYRSIGTTPHPET